MAFEVKKKSFFDFKYNAFDVISVEYSPHAEFRLVNSNSRLAGRMQG